MAVGTAIAGIGSTGRDIPATAVIGRLRVDDNEAILVGKTSIRSTGVEGVGGARAVVNGRENGRTWLKPVGHVDVHARTARVVAEVVDPRERRSLDERRGLGEGDQSQEARDEGRDLHSVKSRAITKCRCWIGGGGGRCVPS